MALSESEELELLELERSRHMALARTPAPITAQEKSEPTFMQGLKAGLTAQPGKGVGHFIGSALPSTVGGVIGSVVPGPGTVIGATLGEAARQAAGAIVAPEETAKKSPLEIGAQVIGAGVGQKVGEAIAGPAISGIKKAAGFTIDQIKKVLPQAIKVMSGVSEKTTARILNNPEILTTAKPIEEAEKEFGQFIKNSGFEYGPKAMAKVLGKAKWSEAEADAVANNVIARIERLAGTDETGMSAKEIMEHRWLQRAMYKPEGPTPLGQLPENKKFIKQTTQQALAARQSLSHAATTEITGGHNDMAKYLLDKVDIIDDWIEKIVPGFDKVRQDYSNAKAAQAFESWLPVNKTGTPSFLRGAALGGLVSTGNIHEALAMSPKLTGMALKGAVKSAPYIEKAAGNISALAEQISKRVGAPIAVETIQKGIETERADHPEIPQEYLPNLVADELKKDPKFYDKE